MAENEEQTAESAARAVNVKSVKNVAEFLKAVDDWKRDNSLYSEYFYRGESDADYKLSAAIFRKDAVGNQIYKQNAEKEILEEFASYFHEEFRNKTAFEKLMMAQHYGVPTRLLDISLNPLIALHFACQNEQNEQKDGHIRVFGVREGKILTADSDKLNIICHLAYLTDGQGNDIKGIIDGANAIPTVHSQKLTDELKKDNFAYHGNITREHLTETYFVKPVYSNPRIRAQSGGFMVSAFAEEYAKIQENDGDGKSCARFLIKAAAKKSILEELDSLHINEMTLFPEMEHAANYLKEKYKEKYKNA